jgi:hypothetical protein
MLLFFKKEKRQEVIAAFSLMGMQFLALNRQLMTREQVANPIYISEERMMVVFCKYLQSEAVAM